MPPRPPSRSDRYPERDRYSDRDGYPDREGYPDRDNYSERDRYSERESYMPDTPKEKSGLKAALNWGTMAILAAVFVLGLGIGITFGSSPPSSDNSSIATRADIDRNAPNPELCLQYGASAVTLDLRAYMTLSPFNVYVSQPKMQPGCVIRNSNWNVLQNRGVVDNKSVNECRNRMNTFGFTGDIEKQDAAGRQIDCIYQNDAAKNLFLPQTGGEAPPESNRF